jgi:hypothetical protein
VNSAEKANFATKPFGYKPVVDFCQGSDLADA